MNKETLKEYAELKIQDKKICERLDELKPIVTAELVSGGLDKLPTNLGNFNLKKVKKWTYSEAVKKMEADLKALKATEEAHGTATFVEVEQLEFRENKDGTAA